jgi:hypothetical protein
MANKTKIRRQAIRYWEPGTIFREADGLYTVTDCLLERTSSPRVTYEIHLRELTVEEAMVAEVMIK